MKRLIRKLKTYVRAALGKDLFVRPDIVCARERFGTEYGGWVISPESINAHSIIYSFGIGEDASFDLGLADRFGCTIHAFDPTPKSIDWVKRQKFSDRFVLHEYGIAAFDGDISFNPPENPKHVSYTMLDRPSTQAKAVSAPVKRLNTIMAELGHDHIDILKMDIEGAEYDVIDDIKRSTIRPRQFLVEFHHRFPSVGIQKTKEAINQLRDMGYGLFSISASNEEYCFIQKSSL